MLLTAVPLPRVFLVRSPVAYHPAGSRWGTATLKFYEGRDILTGCPCPLCGPGHGCDWVRAWSPVSRLVPPGGPLGGLSSRSGAAAGRGKGEPGWSGQDPGPAGAGQPGVDQGPQVDRGGPAAQPGGVPGGADVSEPDPPAVAGGGPGDDPLDHRPGWAGALECFSAGLRAGGAQQPLVRVNGHRPAVFGGSAARPQRAGQARGAEGDRPLAAHRPADAVRAGDGALLLVHDEVVDLSGVDLDFCLSWLVVTLRTRLQRDWSGLDVVLLHDAAEAEDLSVRGGDPLFEVTLGGSPGGAFVPELGGEDVHDAAVGGDGRGRTGSCTAPGCGPPPRPTSGTGPARHNPRPAGAPGLTWDPRGRPPRPRRAGREDRPGARQGYGRPPRVKPGSRDSQTQAGSHIRNY